MPYELTGPFCLIFFFLPPSDITQQKHDRRSTFPLFPSSCIVWNLSAALDHVLAPSLFRTGREEAGSVGALSWSGRWGPGLRRGERRVMFGQDRL